MKKFVLMLSVLALAAFGLVACGDDEEEPTSEATTTETSTSAGGGSGGSGGSVSITADSSALAYDESAVTAPAGEVTIEFDNPSSIGHDVVVEDADANELARTDVISGETTSTSAEFEAGDYTFFCSVDGHRAAGMEGEFKVE